MSVISITACRIAPFTALRTSTISRAQISFMQSLPSLWWGGSANRPRLTWASDSWLRYGQHRHQIDCADCFPSHDKSGFGEAHPGSPSRSATSSSPTGASASVSCVRRRLRHSRSSRNIAPASPLGPAGDDKDREREGQRGQRQTADIDRLRNSLVGARA